MAEDYAVANMPVALEKRLYPTITVWNRLEGRPRRKDFSRALKADVRDGMFMLTKQWQMGEFLGDDAGSPATAKLQVATTRLRTYQAARGKTTAFDESLPLEARVERRALPLTRDGHPMALDIRLLMGRQWLKMTAVIADYTAAFVQRYPFRPPDPTREQDAYACAHPETWQLLAAIAGRGMDGGWLYTYLTGGAGRHAWDGIASILPGHRSAIEVAEKAFIEWYTTTFTQPPSAGEDAWLSDRLEYQFACGAPEGATETVFNADEYYQGRLDWYNLDVDRSRKTLGRLEQMPPDPQATSLQALIPVPITYDGMPNTRWWAFEDRRVNFGAVTPATTDLGKLLFLEFGLVYANDWFLIPLTLDAGSSAAGAGRDDAWQRWSMFTLSVKGNEPGQAADTGLLLLPVVPKIQEGRDLEEVMLVRDEVANMVWGVEKTISLASGRDKPGAEAAAGTLSYYQRLLDESLGGLPPTPAITPAAPIAYNVMNRVPENWIPFIPVHVPNDIRATQLQRAAMPRLLKGDPNPPAKVRPQTVLLRDGLDTTPKARYFLHEEEVPRAGALVSQGYQRTRWVDGRVIVWLGARKQTGRGEGSSGLRFDQIVAVPAAAQAEPG